MERQRYVLATEPMLSAADVLAEWSLDVDELLGRGSIFALDDGRAGQRFPAFQFDHDGPRAEIELVLRPMHAAGLAQSDVCEWFFRPRPELDGRTPAVACSSFPARVLDLAAADTRQWARQEADA